MLRQFILHWTSASAVVLAVVCGAAAQATTKPAQTPAVPSLNIYGFVQTDFGYDLRSTDPNWFDVNRPSKRRVADHDPGELVDLA